MAIGTPTTSSGSGSPVVVAVPSGVAANDIIILIVSIDNPSTTITAWPSGFTQLDQRSVTGDGQNYGLAWKRLTGADTGNYSITLSGLGGTGAAAIPISGRDTSIAPSLGTVTVQNAAVTGATNTITASSVIASVGDDIIHVSLPDVTTANIGNGHTGWTLGTEIVDLIDAGSGWCNIGVAKLENVVSAGATGSQSVTFNKSTTGGAAWITYMIRFTSAGAVPVTFNMGTTNAVLNLAAQVPQEKVVLSPPVAVMNLAGIVPTLKSIVQPPTSLLTLTAQNPTLRARAILTAQAILTLTANPPALANAPVVFNMGTVNAVMNLRGITPTLSARAVSASAAMSLLGIAPKEAMRAFASTASLSLSANPATPAIREAVPIAGMNLIGLTQARNVVIVQAPTARLNLLSQPPFDPTALKATQLKIRALGEANLNSSGERISR